MGIDRMTMFLTDSANIKVQYNWPCIVLLTLQLLTKILAVSINRNLTMKHQLMLQFTLTGSPVLPSYEALGTLCCEESR